MQPQSNSTAVCKFFDRDNKLVGEAKFQAFPPGFVVRYGGVVYKNGGEGGFYDKNEYYELVEEKVSA